MTQEKPAGSTTIPDSSSSPRSSPKSSSSSSSPTKSLRGTPVSPLRSPQRLVGGGANARVHPTASSPPAHHHRSQYYYAQQQRAATNNHHPIPALIGGSGSGGGNAAVQPFSTPGTTTRPRSTSMGSWVQDAPVLPSAVPHLPHSPRSTPVSPVTGAPSTNRYVSSSAALHSGGAAAVGGGGLMKIPGGIGAAPCIPPPEPSETRKAMEAAAAAERTRARAMEEDELHLNADEVRAVLRRERARCGRMAADLAALKCAAVQSQLEAEVIEEGRINHLMRRMDHLQREKGRIILELEREEEMLTNTLQKKLNEVRREKALLEEQIDHEKKSNSALQSQLSSMRDHHLPVAEALEEEEEMEEE